MRFSDIGEFGFIDRINVETIQRPGGIVQGIGDDAAVFETRPGWLMVLTTDMLVEGVHFLRDAIDPFRLGRKSLAVNLSDVAAMGAEPLDAYISLAIPPHVPVEEMEETCAGMRDIAKAHRVNLLGGDTTRSPGPLVINVALTGHAPRDQVVLRSGARPGEGIYVTGWLGDAGAGLDIIRNQRRWDRAGTDYLLAAHLDPRPHLEEGRLIAENHFASAMIDLSDGVASDLGHICRRSGVGALIHEADLPLSERVRAYALAFGLDLQELSLATGEDYGLLLTVPAGRSTELERVYGERFGRPIWRIGETTGQGEMVLLRSDGSRVPLVPRGWDAFKGVTRPGSSTP